MTEKVYDPGDWVVHHNYGLGHIQRIEKKRIGGETQRYYRVKNNDSVFWIPVETGSKPRVRPIVTKRQLNAALKEFSKDPESLSRNYKQRKREIEEAVADGKLRSACGVIRDLYSWRQQKTFNEHERRIYDTLTKRLLREWSVCAGIKVQEARKKLNSLLSKVLDRTPEKA